MTIQAATAIDPKTIISAAVDTRTPVTGKNLQEGYAQVVRDQAISAVCRLNTYDHSSTGCMQLLTSSLNGPVITTGWRIAMLTRDSVETTFWLTTECRIVSSTGGKLNLELNLDRLHVEVLKMLFNVLMQLG